jgi:hypothetical protein
MAKKDAKKRTRMSEAEVEQYLKHYAKDRDLNGKALGDAVRRCAATRWAALERNSKKEKKGKKGKKGKK